MDAADEFLNKCVEDGRLNKEELADVSLYRSSRGYSQPDSFIQYDDFITLVSKETGFQYQDAEKLIAQHLRSARLTPLHVVLYINYPAYTERELAERLSIHKDTVRRHLGAVRRAWRGLRFDVSEGKWGVPSLKDMLRITHNDSCRLDDDGSVIKF